MLRVLGSRPGPDWTATVKKLKTAVRDKGKEILTRVVTDRQAALVKAARAVKVSSPMPALGKPMHAKDAGFAPSGMYGDPWVQTVVATLNQQFNLSIQPPRPGALADAYSLPYGIDETKDQLVIGFASLSALNAATQYSAKLLLRTSASNPYRTVNKRGRQLMFYDWHANGPNSGKWRTAAWVGTPDGRATPVDPDYAGRNPGMWRAGFPGLPGYWADHEYGTADSAAPPAIIPDDPDEGIVMLFIRLDGAVSNIAPIGKKGDKLVGQPANLLLTRTAFDVWNVIYGQGQDVTRDAFLAAVRTAMA